MSKFLSYDEIDKKQLIDWIELCHDLLDEKGVKDSERGALYSVFGRLGIYAKENEARIAALEARLQEAEAIIKPFANEDFSRELSGNFEGDLSPVFQRVQAMLTLGDFRRARAFLNHK